MISADTRRKILDAVDTGFDAQLATTRDFVAIPSTRGAEGPCQDMIGDLLRERGYEVDDWHIDLDDLRELRGYGPIEHDFSKARTVVGTYRPRNNAGKSLILQGHCDVVPAGPLDLWETPPFSPTVKDGKMYGRGACDMKSGTIGALYALDAIKAAGLKPTARIHFQSVIEEESTGVGALSTLQRGYRADACFIPEPTGGKMVRSQVGVIWFRLKVRGFPVHVSHAGSGSNAITAAYHLIHALEKLEAEWNERARADRHFKALVHPINFNPGIIKGGDWASSVPAWCDVDCRIAVLPGWSIADCQKEILACVSGAARDHRFLSNNPPDVEWSGFLSEGYELTNSAEAEAAFGKAFTSVYGREVQDLVFTALTDTRFYGLNYRACASAPAVRRCMASTNMSTWSRCGSRPRRPRCSLRSGAGSSRPDGAPHGEERRRRVSNHEARLRPHPSRRRFAAPQDEGLPTAPSSTDTPPLPRRSLRHLPGRSILSQKSLEGSRERR